MMSRLHFQPIRGKSLDIIRTIHQAEELKSLGDAWNSVRLVIEELVVNIVNYAYPEGSNDYLDLEIIRDPERVTLCFHDGGIPFNPLERKLPDPTMPIRKRRIGGLGIALVIKMADTIAYEHTNGENVLTVSIKYYNS